jgi:hypothetical protein
MDLDVNVEEIKFVGEEKMIKESRMIVRESTT